MALPYCTLYLEDGDTSACFWLPAVVEMRVTVPLDRVDDVIAELNRTRTMLLEMRARRRAAEEKKDPAPP